MSQDEITLHSIYVGQPQRYDDGDGRQWESAIAKSPVHGRVEVGPEGLVGDAQADRKHHGGADKAVLAYARQHYDLWQADYPLSEHPQAQFAPGGFGENLAIDGMDETSCCVGDQFRIGDCILEVSQPRQPCWKLDRRWQIPKLAVAVQRNGRSGWYLRVLQAGAVEPGMSVELLQRPFPQYTIAEANRIMYAKPRQPERDAALAACPALSASWHQTLSRRASGKGTPDESARLSGQAEKR